MIFRKLWAFLKRDLKIETSYRLAFLMNFTGIFLSVTAFFFISKLVGSNVNAYLEPYGGDYFAFVLVGIALSGFMGTGLGAFASSISSAQNQGTLEAMLVTPTRHWQVVMLSAVWGFVLTTLNVVVYLLVGMLVFGMRVAWSGLGVAVVILLLIVAIFSAFGVISASFVMVLKRGDPLGRLLGPVSSILGGTFFPVQVMPAWLQKLSYFFPLFYALRAMRLAVLRGFGIDKLAPDIAVLVGFLAVLLPLCVACFSYAVRRAKIDGSLGTY